MGLRVLIGALCSVCRDTEQDNLLIKLCTDRVWTLKPFVNFGRLTEKAKTYEFGSKDGPFTNPVKIREDIEKGRHSSHEDPFANS